MTSKLVLVSYSAVLVAMFIVEWTARRRPDLFTPLGDMLNLVMRSRTVRLGLIAAWWWLGWHFLFADTVQLHLE